MYVLLNPLLYYLSICLLLCLLGNISIIIFINISRIIPIINYIYFNIKFI